MDVFKQIATVVAHWEVEGAVEAALLLTQAAHLMVPCSINDTRTNLSVSIWQSRLTSWQLMMEVLKKKSFQVGNVPNMSSSGDFVVNTNMQYKKVYIYIYMN